MKPNMGKGDRLQPAVARSLPGGVQAPGAHRNEEEFLLLAQKPVFPGVVRTLSLGVATARARPMDIPRGWLPLQGVDATVQKVEPAKLSEPLYPLKTLEPKMLPKPSSSTGAQSLSHEVAHYPGG